MQGKKLMIKVELFKKFGAHRLKKVEGKWVMVKLLGLATFFPLNATNISSFVHSYYYSSKMLLN